MAKRLWRSSYIDFGLHGSLGEITVPTFGRREAIGRIETTLPPFNLRLHSHVDDERFAALSKVESRFISALDASGSSITDRSAKVLAKLSGLTELNLSQTAVTDASLPYLCSLASLRVLDLSGTRVTDQGLRSFPPLRGLVEVDLRGTLVTASGAQTFQQHWPDLRVHCISVYASAGYRAFRYSNRSVEARHAANAVGWVLVEVDMIIGTISDRSSAAYQRALAIRETLVELEARAGELAKRASLFGGYAKSSAGSAGGTPGDAGIVTCQGGVISSSVADAKQLRVEAEALWCELARMVQHD